MNLNKDKVSVMIVEPNQPLAGRLLSLAQGVYGVRDVLPRATVKEALYAARFLDCEVLVVRASVLRGSPSLSELALCMLSAGRQVVFIRESFDYSWGNTLTLAGMHFLPCTANDDHFQGLLTRCLLRSIAGRTAAN